MRRPSPCCILFISLWSAVAAAVHVSSDNFGQVVIFPYLLAADSGGRQSLIELRNGDPDRHMLVSFQVKHLFGRPLLSANVVLGPNGSFATALLGSKEGVRLAEAPAGQCAVPDLSSESRLLSYAFIDGPVTRESRQRFIVEAYALGYIDASLAADCEALRARYEPGGVWAPRNSSEFRNAEVAAPDNSLTGWSTVIDSRQVTTLHLRPLVLADFTETALNIAPAVATRPSLMDVNPFVSRRIVSSSNGPMGEHISSWAEPIHAVDALFMSTSLEANLSLGGTLSASSNVIAYYPTRAYHQDPLFWNANPGLAPFDQGSSDIQAVAYDRAGAPLDVFPGAGDCGRNDASQLEITGLLYVALTNPCGEGEAFLRVDGNTGSLVLSQSGEPIISLEGHRYAGLPVIGHSLITLRTRFENGVPLARELSYSWARPMPAKTAITVD